MFSCEYHETHKDSFFCITIQMAAPEVVSRHKLLLFKPSFFPLVVFIDIKMLRILET